MKSFQDILNIIFWGNTLLNYFIALSVFFFLILGIIFVRGFFLKRIKIWSDQRLGDFSTLIFGFIDRVFLPLSYFGAFYIGISFLVLSEKIRYILKVFSVALITVIIVSFVITILEYSLKLYEKKKSNVSAKASGFRAILAIVKVLIWGVAVLFFLDNIGFKISTIIAGLGIGGIAIGLAAQAVLKDLFSYFSIIFDKPFELGDFIVVGDFRGTVEHIGLKTTRLRSVNGEELIFSNTDLTDSRVKNFKRMQKRRVSFELGITYDTPVEKLKEIPKVVEDIINKTDRAIFHRAYFSKYGDFSLIFEVVYYVDGREHSRYVQVHQNINLEIKRIFEERKIEFAYPTQTLYLNK